ncbi:hypothetical protein CPB84DRAFT_1845692 [Gymnopilus junonius]|uniref:HNH nuclease domain-containing protein n=1 Tax=Gymnopilus junonius TaxID=109634 RepID=A0A9P5NP65_GYMJU|nr:hypothetical protein CPB84DRAFT_1845692 [Gymnopilus junonius]
MSNLTLSPSLEAYQDPIIQLKISEIKESPTSLQDLVEQAEKYVAKFALVEEHVLSYKEAEVDLDRLFNSILFHADEAGGEKSLLLREAYGCPLTGSQDLEHPSPHNLNAVIQLQGTHIIRRAIADFDEDHNTSTLTFLSVQVRCCHILVNFACLPVDELADLKAFIDYPSNGTLLQSNALWGFETLRWCLQKTAQDDIYEVKKLLHGNGISMRQDGVLIVFRDRSGEIVNQGSRKRSYSISMPRSLELCL